MNQKSLEAEGLRVVGLSRTIVHRLPRVKPTAQSPHDRAVPKLRPPSPRLSTIGSASLAARLVAEHPPRSAFRPSVDMILGVHSTP
jgi:hypothetical protein